MPKRELPTVAEALVSLREAGDQFGAKPAITSPLGDVTYNHPTKGRKAVKADKLVLRAIDTLYVPHKRLRQIIQARAGNTRRFARLRFAVFIARSYLQPQLVWGVSGFASRGFNCAAEAVALDVCYGYFTASKKQRPQLVVDGGACAGALGLNGVLAEKYGLATLGITPLQGVASMAPRRRMLFHRHTYREREAMIGMLVDALLCIGGGDGTKREALATLRNGGCVLLVASTANDPRMLAGSWQSVPEFVQAEREGRWIVCHSVDELRASLTRISQVALPARRKRLRRFVNVSKMLLKQVW